MKTNLPVTDNEIIFDANQQIVSKTDLKGRITYINQDFLDISGFSESELIGKSHNIVRHPDMPPAAFQSLWDAVKADKPWVGMVKNRCKNGDYYWVEANVTPIKDNGRVEFMSVRKKPTREKIAEAESLYQSINNNTYTPSFKEKFERYNIFNKMSLMQNILIPIMVLFVIFAGLSVIIVPDIFNSLMQVQSADPIIIFEEILIGFLVCIAGLLVVLLSWFINKNVNKPLQDCISTLNNIAVGNFDDQCDIEVNGVIGDVLRALKSMQIKQGFDVNEARFFAKNSDRIQTALDVTTTNVMMADANNTIIYMNEAVQNMFNELDSELKKVLPKFDASKLMGENIDVFHKNPAHQQGLLRDLKETYNTTMPVGSLTMEITANPVFSKNGERLGTVVEWVDRTADVAAKVEDDKRLEAERVAAMDNSRIKTALDVTSTNIMMADTELNIIYMNEAVQQMFKSIETELKISLPNFDASNLIGTNIDDFHKNPAHQRSMLKDLKTTYNTILPIGNLTMEITATPVFDDAGKRVGFVTEWMNRTAEVEVENEVENIVEAAANGDFSQHIKETGKEGFYLKLAEGINKILETTNTGIDDVVRVLRALATGDLTQNIEADYKGVFNQLKGDVNTSIERLTDVISKVHTNTDGSANTALEVNSTAQALGQGSSEQAASLEEISSSMEEMSANIRQSADNAGQTEQIAQKAAVDAETSGKTVSEAVGAMKDIADKISIIEEISRQTNLGKGFAVVAAEVRKLAERSQQAASEIGELSSTTVELAEQAGENLLQLVPDIQKTAELVQEISVASREQDTGADEINKAIQQLDQVVQQSAASAEELAASANELTNQVEDQRIAMGFFTLAESETADTPVERRNNHSSGSKLRGEIAPMKSPTKKIPDKNEGFDYGMDDSANDEFVRY